MDALLENPSPAQTPHFPVPSSLTLLIAAGFVSLPGTQSFHRGLKTALCTYLAASKARSLTVHADKKPGQMSYQGRLAIVAGGLGGLGSETAKLLHAEGASLALLYAPFEADRRDTLLAAAFGTPTPPTIRTYEADITDESSVAQAFAAISAELTTHDPPVFPSILINAAGYVSVQPLTSTSAAEAAKNILPNLLGPFIVSNAFHELYTSTPTASSKPPGRIVSISSQAAHVALPNHGAYCASKAGLLGLVRSQALEWGPEGITSNSVSPTVAMTELGRKAWADKDKREEMLAQIPVGRFLEPQEIAVQIEWLCRDEGGMVNGADVRIDGGEFPSCKRGVANCISGLGEGIHERFWANLVLQVLQSGSPQFQSDLRRSNMFTADWNASFYLCIFNFINILIKSDDP